MARTPADDTSPPTPKSSSAEAARQARQAEALRANLRRRKAQSRGRAEQEDGGPEAADRAAPGGSGRPGDGF